MSPLLLPLPAWALPVARRCIALPYGPAGLIVDVRQETHSPGHKKKNRRREVSSEPLGHAVMLRKPYSTCSAIQGT